MDSDAPRIIEIVKISDPRGNLSVLENPGSLPFDPARAYWLYNLPSANSRDGHAYYAARELIVAMSGSVEVVTQRPDGREMRFTLTRPDRGLLVEPLTWRTIENFTSNAVVLVVTDTLFDETDYIRDPALFRSLHTPLTDD